MASFGWMLSRRNNELVFLWLKLYTALQCKDRLPATNLEELGLVQELTG
jgi:hypothetical protein